MAHKTKTHPYGLTERELEVLRLSAQGLSYKQLADALYVARSTVRMHVKNIFGKTGFSRRAEIVAELRKLGWIS
jgi:DNA-binding CsgD family transcriptional regulator